jgi:hypothetical protein
MSPAPAGDPRERHRAVSADGADPELESDWISDGGCHLGPSSAASLRYPPVENGLSGKKCRT